MTYQDRTNLDLKYATCASACGSSSNWTKGFIDQTGSVGQHSSIEVGSNGRRHVAYGVEARHYMAVREALLWTLEDALGADFCQDARTGWRTAYVLLSARMMMGAARVVLAA